MQLRHTLLRSASVCLGGTRNSSWKPDSIISRPEPLSFLSSKMKAQERSAASAANSADTVVTEFARYVTDAAEAGDVRALDF